MNKRLIIILVGIIGFLAIVGVLLFLAVKKQKEPAAVSTTGVQIKNIVDTSVISPVAGVEDKNLIWYFNSENRLFSVKSDGTGLSEFALPALSGNTISKILWPKVGHDFIAVSGFGAQEKKSYFNNAKRIYINLPANIRSLDWLPDGQRVIYVWQANANHQQLVMANSDGSGYKLIKDLTILDMQVAASPDGKTALLWASPTSDLNKIYYVDLASGNFGTAVDFGKNTSATWISPSQFIFTQTSTTAYPKVMLYDFGTHNVTDLKFNTTLDKVVMSPDSQTLYAAVPKADNSGDVFMKMDMTTEKLDTYFEPTSEVRATNLFFAGNTIYFINTKDSKLYSLGE